MGIYSVHVWFTAYTNMFRQIYVCICRHWLAYINIIHIPVCSKTLIRNFDLNIELLASFPCPSQLSVACSTHMQGEPGNELFLSRGCMTWKFNHHFQRCNWLVLLISTSYICMCWDSNVVYCVLQSLLSLTFQKNVPCVQFWAAFLP